ncbi:nuclear transport factor 2 family protein [Spiribacter vilamensis]|uniref:Steroid delta-isomerase n=1 Tax=Spiribacter vilamensis TaxID=531306 RepID=A0A4Q8D1P0_9GAMM|nr:nuclear transport factor 2 family protein [Spiribacter vilamensis]RZU99180.1 steroid delta-isomerase [Spiribacter vilamensis]TVO61832.1 nuclear transport factor 2 family protein [Spiribacter vilamensis]
MTALERYGEFFAGMQPADLDRLDDVFVDNARFRDPFNDVEGIAAIRAVFEHMYANCAEARFEVLESVGEDDIGYLRWRFHFRLKRDKAARRPVDGVSRIVLADDGRVREHVDYWDAAGELYEQFPVIGGLMRWLRSRLAVATD